MFEMVQMLGLVQQAEFFFLLFSWSITIIGTLMTVASIMIFRGGGLGHMSGLGDGIIAMLFGYFGVPMSLIGSYILAGFYFGIPGLVFPIVFLVVNYVVQRIFNKDSQNEKIGS